jgi:hypothetical protein
MTRDGLRGYSDHELSEIRMWIQLEQDDRNRARVIEWIKTAAACVGLKVRIRRNKRLVSGTSEPPPQPMRVIL